MGPEKSIIIKADDRGNDPGTNQGIDELVKMGIVTDVSLIAQFTAEPERDSLLKVVDQSPLKDGPGVGLVLHVNTVTGRSAARPEAVPSMVDSSGRFIRPAEPTKTAWEEYIAVLRPDDIQRELDAQVTKFYQLFGHYPHALDSHNIILGVPPVDEMAMQMAGQIGCALTVPRIFTNDLVDGPFPEKYDINQPLWAEQRKRRIPGVDHGIIEYFNRFEELEDSVQSLLSALGNLKNGITELWFHPGHPDYADKATDWRFARGRVRDYQILTDPRVASVILQTSRTSYRQLSSKTTLAG